LSCKLPAPVEQNTGFHWLATSRELWSAGRTFRRIRFRSSSRPGHRTYTPLKRWFCSFRYAESPPRGKRRNSKRACADGPRPLAETRSKFHIKIIRPSTFHILTTSQEIP